MQGDQTASKLKMRAPSSSIMPLAEVSAKPGLMAKIKLDSEKTAKETISELPLSQDDAVALAKIIKEAGAKGIPLDVRDICATEGGKIKVTLAMKSLAGLSTSRAAEERMTIYKTVHHIVVKNAKWQAGLSSDLVFTTVSTLEGLGASRSAPKSDTLKDILDD